MINDTSYTNCPDRVAIVGAGLSGALLALRLSHLGYGVDLFESRPDPRLIPPQEGRSINLGLSKRGMNSLASVGLLEDVMDKAVVMKGRVIHGLDCSTHFQPYGKNDNEVLHSIERTDINMLLLEAAEKDPQLQIHFNHKFVGLNKNSRELTFEYKGELVQCKPGWLVGADGAFSKVRQEMQRGERADFRQEYLEWGYKELHLTPDSKGKSRIDLTALHLWPRDKCLIVSHPNLDGSHTLTLFLPFEGEESLTTLNTRDKVETFLLKQFPDLKDVLEQLVNHWFQHPVGSLITTCTSQWSYQDWTVLVGDACHAQYPFYGQGMNSAFEDCCLLVDAIEAHKGDLQVAFQAYESKRRPHTTALSELSKENFTELKEKVRSPMFLMRKKLDLMFNRLWPKRWLPLYTMIAHTTMPYADARARAVKQDKILNAMIAGISSLSLMVILASIIL